MSLNPTDNHRAAAEAVISMEAELAGERAV